MENGTARTTSQKVVLFRRFFTGLKDVYGTYDLASGHAFQIKRPVTDAVILGHLKGQQSYGVYLLVKDRTSAVAVDFDKANQLPPMEFVARAKHYSIPAYIERSKSKGYHVWVFFDERGVPAAKARLVVQHILEEIDHPEPEIFPKHDSLNNNVSFGNFINAPLFGALVPKGRTVFVDPSDTMKPYPNQWDFLESIRRVPERILDEIIEINGLAQALGHRFQDSPPRQNHRRFPFGLPPCARKMLTEGVRSYQRISCFRLAVHLKRLGLPFDIAVAALKVWALKNCPTDGKRVITESEILAQTTSAFKKEYRTCGCEESAIRPYCHRECPLYIKRQIGRSLENTETRMNGGSLGRS